MSGSTPTAAPFFVPDLTAMLTDAQRADVWRLIARAARAKGAKRVGLLDAAVDVMGDALANWFKVQFDRLARAGEHGEASGPPG